jgi:uncharacterized protein YbjT (DUF2867 family)
MSGKTATIIGVTGLIGNYLYEEIKARKSFEKIRLVVRRPYEKDDERTEIRLIDFDDPGSLISAVQGSDAVFVAIGTTQKKVKGDKIAYRKVDYDIPVNAAMACKAAGCEKFIFVSSVGASSKSVSFYLRLKGEVEETIKTIGISSVHAMRPSMLVGERKEFRWGEKIGNPMMIALSIFLPSKYIPIHGRVVAKAMLNASNDKREGFFVYQYNEILKMSRT